MHKIKRSPLFYVWDKYKLLEEIKQYLPQNIDSFVEPFLWGWSPFLNIEAKSYILNDIDSNIYKIHKFLLSKTDHFIINNISKLTKSYNLSRSYIEDIVPSDIKKKFPKTYYAKFNKVGYNKLKNDFNDSMGKPALLLYILLIYGFNRMVRFNSKNEFNLPVWNVDCNKNVIDAIKNYTNFTKNKKIELHNLDYQEFLKKIKFKTNDFIYLDPPYLITHSEYNKIRTEKNEEELLSLLDRLDSEWIKFAISNVTKYKWQYNYIFIDRMKKYKNKKIKSNYISYHDNSKKDFEEVLVFNY